MNEWEKELEIFILFKQWKIVLTLMSIILIDLKLWFIKQKRIVYIYRS